MSLVKVSSKGQITIPVKVRAFLGVEAKDRLKLVVRGDEVVIQPLRLFRNLRGSVAHKKGKARRVMEDAVVRHVLETDK